MSFSGPSHPGSWAGAADVTETDQEAEAVSDSGSDAEEFRSNIAEFDRSVREFLETHYQRRVDTGNYQPATYGRGRSGPRGPRKAVGPTGDLKSRLGQASQAFASERYDDALDLLFEVIRINAETHQAWVMLASVFREFGDADRALNAMVYACHLRPKDVEGWIACASFALDGPHEWRTRNLTAASLCYAAALRADPKSRVARLGKAAVCHERGFLNQALAEYRVLLNENPLDIGTIRLMAEVCLAKSDAAGARSAVDMTLDAYRQCIALLRPKGVPAPEQFGWVDVSAYVRLYAVKGSPLGAIAELSSLARWLLGRQDESFWDGYLDDDREWDSSDERRMCIPDFSAGRSSPRRYGDGLPLDLRALLAEYRLRTGNIAEAKHHLSFLEPSEASTVSLVSSQPQLFSELASHLLDAGLVHESRGYYELIRAAFPSATVLLQLGRCHLRLHNRPAAEELFLEAINVDEDNIDARVELATMYELAKEDEEAFILVNEALGLLAKMDLVRTGRRPYARRGPGSRTSRHRPRRLVEPRERVEAEKARAALVRDKFIAAQSLREQLEQGDESTIDSWMHLAKELIDDFRQVKHFYSWDRYLRNIGLSEHGGESRETERQERSLSSMAERLSRNLAPQEASSMQAISQPGDSHRGIPLTQWLDLFMDYALSLARAGRSMEAYEICESARDASVFSRSSEAQFLVHLTWGTCAVFCGDEETCVAVARFFMRDERYAPDSYRLFSALCRACQAPVSWYASGPAQKFILRQIKAMDARLSQAQRETGRAGAPGAPGREATAADEGLQDREDGGSIAANLLMLYGHIMFTSTSYVYALNYFIRALALDPSNPIINLSAGLAYLHHALKRQAENRQYLLAQSFSFLHKYHSIRLASSNVRERQEAHYNLARSYHLINLPHLAIPYYLAALREQDASTSPPEETTAIVRECQYNLRTCYLACANSATAKRLLHDMVL